MTPQEAIKHILSALTSGIEAEVTIEEVDVLGVIVKGVRVVVRAGK